MAQYINKSENFNLDVSTGGLHDVENILVIGHNPAISTSDEHVWSAGGTYAFPAATSTLRVKAGGNAADTAAGLGAQSVTLEYLDANFRTQTETLATAGASASLPTGAAIRLQKAYVTNSGTYGAANTAAITIEAVTGGATLAVIPAAGGTSKSSIYTVPKGYTAYLTKFTATISNANSADISIYKRENADDFTTTPFTSPQEILVLKDITGTHDYNFNSYIILPEKTDIWATAIRVTGSGDTEVTTVYNITLIRN